MILETFKSVNKNLKAILIVTPLINILSIWILVTLHWTIWQGKYGYFISSFFVVLGLIILMSLIILSKKLKFNGLKLFNVLVILALCYLVYVDLNFLAVAISNNGFIPCTLGPSCP